MTLPAKTLTLLVLISLAASGLLLIATITLATRKRSAAPQAVAMDDMLRGVVDGQAQAFQRLEQAIRQLAGEQLRIAHSVKGAIQRVGLVRYDAFEDVGGRLSFSCAMLNDDGDGVVVTSINGRQDTRVYAKPVYRGESEHNLSDEEAAAIREAMVGPRQSQTVEAT